MIGFLEPLALFGLAAAAIPPLLHLIGRRLPPTVLFPAVRYLTATEREHSRRLRLRNLLLLLLRTAIILLAVLAAARPVARVPAGSGHPPAALALVLDNSLSSGAVAGGRRVLDLLAERARRVVDGAGVEDHLWLVLADGIPQRLTPADARALMDSLSPSPLRLDLGRAVRAAAAAVAAAPLAEHEVVVLSDVQQTALSSGPAPSVRVLVWEPPTPPANRGVESALAEPGVWTPEGAVVASVSGAAGEPAAVRLLLDGRDVARAVAVAGDRVVLAPPPPAVGWHASVVELDPDELRADDRWWLPLLVRQPAAVRVAPGAGRFVAEGIAVLQTGRRARRGDDVVVADRPAGDATIVFPPADPSLAGAVNRGLAARGVSWRLGELIEGEWSLEGSVGAARDATVRRRYRLVGSGPVLARAGGEPWLVRSGAVALVASRMEEAWTDLPVRAGFIPFLDLLVNRVALREAWTVGARPGESVEPPASATALLVPTGAVRLPDDRPVPAPLEAGVYFFRGADGDTVGALAVNYDRRESRLTPANARAVRAALGPETLVLGDGAIERELFGAARRADLTGLLIAAAIVAALVEMAVAAAGGRGREPA